MIFFFSFLKHEKDEIFFIKICLKKILGFDCMHENKKYIFFEGENNLKVLRFFFNFSKKSCGETLVF
jgi:hypothetical protein